MASRFSSGQWLKVVEALIDAGVFTNPDMAPRALGLVEQLAPLVKGNNGA